MRFFHATILALAFLAASFSAHAQNTPAQNTTAINAVPWSNGEGKVTGPTVQALLNMINGTYSLFAPLSGATFTGPVSAPSLTVSGLLNNVQYAVGPGIDNTGTTDSSTAISALISSAGEVYFPCGTYLVNLTISNKTNFTLEGEECVILKPYSKSSPVIADVGGTQNVYKGFQLIGPGYATGSSSGITLSSTTNNTKIQDLWVQGFNQYGIACLGTNVSSTTGNDVKHSYSLYNGVANLYYSYCADFHIDNGNQFGGLGTYPTYGAELLNSNAGQFNDNFVWSNGIGVYVNNSYYDWIVRNRITQSNTQGLSVNASGRLQVQDNQSYQNSNGSVGGAEAFKFFNVADVAFLGNQFYDWTGLAHTTYSLTLDASSSNFNATGNIYQNSLPTNTIGPTNISSSATGVTESNNSPTQNAATNNVPISAWSYNSGAGVGGAGSTIYVGQTEASGLNAIPFTVAVGGIVQCFVIEGTANPTTNSYVATLYKNQVSTSLSGTWTGSAYSQSICSVPNAVTVSATDQLLIKIVSSASAPSNNFFGSISESQ